MNRTITTTSITRRRSLRQSLRQSLRHAALALCAVLVALVAASCTADALDGTDTGAPSGNGNPDDVLTFAVGPRPGFTEAAATRGTNTKAVIPVLNQVQDDTRDLPNGKAGFSVQEIAGQARNDRESAPATRATLTDNGTHWEQGDILWLDVRLFRDKQNYDIGHPDALYISALKYDGGEWRYLTEAEAEDLNTGNIPRFSRLVRWPRGWKEWVAPGMVIAAYYAGSGKPDADGTLTIIPAGEIPTTPLIGGGTQGICSLDGKPVPLKFGHYCSRVRIPAGYKVKLTNAQYYSEIGFSPDYGIIMDYMPITEIPARSEATDVFLILDIGGNSTAKLTRGNVSHTFTFPDVTDADGNLTNNGASYTFTFYTSGTETPGGYDLTVATEDDLRAFAQAVNAGDSLPNGKPAAEAKVLQTANIELTKGEWAPIGNGDKPFRGAYNGNGNEISGLSITTATQPDFYKISYAGLFGRVEGAVLTGINLRGVKINIPAGGGEDLLAVGSIAGWLENSTLSLCSADGTVNASSAQHVYAGGIAGFSVSCTISRCRAAVETKATTTTGNRNAHAGGIAGANTSCNFILSCETRDRAVTAERGIHAFAGGITGWNSGLIAFCRTGANAVTAQNGSDRNYAGGLAGYNDGFLYSCYSRATAEAPAGTGSKQAGAIIAALSYLLGDVQYCYATGAADKGTSNLDAVPDNIVYDTNPTAGEIFRVISGYTGEVKSLDNGIGRFWYPFTTPYDPSATPAYGIIPLRTVWTSDGAWNQGDGTYPALNIEEYEGRE